MNRFTTYTVNRMRTNGWLCPEDAKILKSLINRCIDTGLLRTDYTRELYEECCKAVGREPYEPGKEQA